MVLAKHPILDLNDLTTQLFSKISMVIAIFMIFKVSISILQNIADPSKAFDASKGIGSLFKRMVTALAIMTLLIPLNFTQTSTFNNSYAENIQKQGILFGTLTELQNRILNQNVIEKLVLGNYDKDGTTSDSKQIVNDSKRFATTVFLQFIYVNRASDNCKQEAQKKLPDVYKIKEENDSSDVDIEKEGTSYGVITGTGSIYNATCKPAEGSAPIFGKKYYAFVLNGITALLAGLALSYLLLVSSIEIAIRSIKLVLLRVISPIPIISYAAPGSTGKTDMLQTWSQTLVKVYLDLFMRLALMMLTVVIIQSLTKNGLSFEGFGEYGPLVGVMALILGIISVLMFVKEGPKFITDALGIKDSGFGLGRAFGKVGAGLTSAKDLIGNAIKAGGAAVDKLDPTASIFKKMRTALGGATKTVGAGLGAVATAKPGEVSKAMLQAEKRAINKVKSGVGVKDNIKAFFSDEGMDAAGSRLNKYNDQIEAYGGHSSAVSNYKKMLEQESLKSKANYRARLTTAGGGVQQLEGFNYNKFYAALNAAEGETFQYKDSTGAIYTFNKADYLDENKMQELQKSQAAQFESKIGSGEFKNAAVQDAAAQIDYYAKEVEKSGGSAPSSVGVNINNATKTSVESSNAARNIKQSSEYKALNKMSGK
jgi:membrane protein